jgi:hypothetical protein
MDEYVFLRELFEETSATFTTHHCSHKTFGDGTRIKLERYFDLPTITFDMLLKLSEFYGTKTITLDSEVEITCGCPTCGPDYEYTTDIRIYRIHNEEGL